MNKDAFRKTGVLTVFSLVLATGFFASPCLADMMIQVNPNIINIEANRYGDIRILTNLRYSVHRNDAVYLYVNNGENSVAPIRKTRDSLGNLILKFQLQDLLSTEGLSLNIDALNVFEAVVIHDGVDLAAEDDDVYIMEKKGN